MAGVNEPAEIETALETAKTIAVVGCSPDPSRPSHSVTRYLIDAGYEVIPVNPEAAEILGKRCYPDLQSIPTDVDLDVVDVFRRSEFVRAIADAAIVRKARFFWMQDGVVDRGAARTLTAAGIPVAMDRCIFRDREAIRKRGRLIL